MHDKLDTLIENAKKTADKIIGSTAPIRKAYSEGRPNSSPESTVDGTLKAFQVVLDNFYPAKNK